MDLLEQIKAAGVVGCGGAGFPTHVKLAAQGIDTLIINAAECEPLLRTDRWIMVHEPAALVAAVAAVRARLGAGRAVIALKETYTAETAALQTAIAAAGASVELVHMRSFYPAGDEQVVVYEVTGRVVPPAGLPLDVQCVVSNVATMLAVHNAAQGRPFTQKYLTITGAVPRPCVLKAPVGMSFADCLTLAGGSLEDDYIVVSGGPMMGKPFTKEEAAHLFVTKTTSGFLVLPSTARLWQNHVTPTNHIRNRAKSACIQCSFCTQLCPRYLLGHPLETHKIMRRAAGARPLKDQLDDPVIRSAQFCCECGVCELVACPMQLQPRKINVMIKHMLAQQGVRPQKGACGLQPRPHREERKLPTGKAANRAGVGKFYHTEPQAFLKAQPKRVCIALGSHIGAPALPIVQPGDKVVLGQVVAMAQEGKLGADYHASVAGTVTSTDNGVVIDTFF
ncbi:MAG: 4Fe-4S dicluster domain-containing protein [Oscillospiraceae bacterium]|jgi:Na+-translocating ferredoxin:NAD+ oxidoreductase RnfC subunit|nr:4Fe-4S dicluster domain-containing protein [Oscillospiraceae bacterium]